MDIDLLDLVLHVDRHLSVLVQHYGPWIYGILFAVVFCETGLVVTPFLPGDSLLFAIGALAGAGALDLPIVLVLILVAAILGDAVNYRIGAWIGDRVFHEDMRWVNRKHLEKTRRFYARHGAKAIVLARFVPIVRTFAPFVAGIARMHYPTFLTYNVAGGFVWVFGLVLAGYAFGGIPVVKQNFGLVTLGIIGVSLLPLLLFRDSPEAEAGTAPTPGAEPAPGA